MGKREGGTKFSPQFDHVRSTDPLWLWLTLYAGDDRRVVWSWSWDRAWCSYGQQWRSQCWVFRTQCTTVDLKGSQNFVPLTCSAQTEEEKSLTLGFWNVGEKTASNYKQKTLMNELENWWYFPCQVIDYHVKTPLKTDFVFKPAQKSYSHWSLSDWIIFFLVTVPGGSKNQGYWNWEVSPSLTQRHFSHLCK